MSRNFLRRGEQEIKSGLEVVAEYLNSDQEEVARVFNLNDKGEERRFYTIDFVAVVLRWWGRNERERRSLVEGFGRMLAFDALVGAPDRHALNWAVLVNLRDPDAPRRFAPIFDTAQAPAVLPDRLHASVTPTNDACSDPGNVGKSEEPDS